MKRNRTYIAPQQQVLSTQTTHILALSTQNGIADPNSQVLVKDNDWIIFDNNCDVVQTASDWSLSGVGVNAE